MKQGLSRSLNKKARRCRRAKKPLGGRGFFKLKSYSLSESSPERVGDG